MTYTNRLASKLRQRRNARAFDRAVRTASPAMQQELLAAATRQATLFH
jgi:hypothetical protein